MNRLLAALTVLSIFWLWLPFPAPGAEPVVGLVAGRSPRLHAAVRARYYLAPAVGVVIAWSVAVAAGRVWFAGRRRARVRGRLPAWPAGPADPAPAVVVGEVHHPVAVREVASPHWLVVPELGLYTGILICGAIGSGKTSACMRPFARQLFGWQAQDSERRIAGLVLEVKGDFCHQGRGILEDAGRADDYAELGLGGRWQWNPLGDDELDSYSLAYTIASLINQFFGRSKEPFWQQACVNLVRWIIALYRMSPRPWVTLRDVYRGTLDPKLIQSKIAEVEADVIGPQAVRVRTAELSGRMGAAKAWDWEPAGDGVVRAKDDPKLREQLKVSGIAFEVVRLGAADPVRRERLAAVKRWHEQDWQALDQKLRSSIIEGLSVFLSVLDLPEVARVFCPPGPHAPPPADLPAAAAVDVVRPLPPLDEVIDSGRVLCLNMPAGTNPALSRAVGVLLKQAWLQTLLRRPAAMQRDPGRVFRPAVFLCDESRLIPIVATQSISSLRAVLGQSEAWRALLQTLRTRIFLSLADDSSVQIASTLCGQVSKMKASYSVSEQTSRAAGSLLSGSPGDGAGSLSASKSFSQHREALFHPRDFALLGNCQAIVLPCDGRRAHDADRLLRGVRAARPAGARGAGRSLRRRMTCRLCNALTGRRAGRCGSGTRRRRNRGRRQFSFRGGAAMSERRDDRDARREPVRVESREQFDEAVGELFRTGRPIEAPSLEALARWDIDLEDEEGGIEGVL